jgi:hypothetical protein
VRPPLAKDGSNMMLYGSLADNQPVSDLTIA